MFAITVEDRGSRHRATFLVGCEDIAQAVIELASTNEASFWTSGIREISEDTADRIRSARLSNDTELIERVGQELAAFLETKHKVLH